MLLFSLSSVCAKLAGQYDFLSTGFILYYGAVIGLLGVYALLWQQIVKRMPLTSAYAGKAVTVVWGMMWGYFLFDENITLLQCVGAVVIMAGVVLFACADGEDAHV